jgi:hypothetical protein
MFQEAEQTGYFPFAVRNWAILPVVAWETGPR